MRLRSRKKPLKSRTTVLLAAFFYPVLISIIILGAIFTGIWFKSYQSRSWKGIEPFRIVSLIVDDGKLVSAYTLHILPNEPQIRIIGVPVDVEIDTIRGYGPYKVQAIWQLGQVEGAGEQLIHQSLEHLFGVRFQRLLVSDQSVDSADGQKIIAHVRQQLLHWNRFPIDSWYDNWRVYKRLQQVSDVSVSNSGFDALRLVAQTDNVDGSLLRYVDELRLDSYISSKITPTHPETSALGVVVQNATSYPGLAAHWSRFVAHGGFDLLRLNDTASATDSSVLIFQSDELRKSSAGMVLQALFPTFTATVEDVSMYRGDVLLRLGEDAKSELTSRNEL